MKYKSQSGFTIVELLIVVIVIAILATITIVSFNNIQARANESAVKSDLRNFNVRMQQYRAENNFYPATLVGVEGLGFTKNLYGQDWQRYNLRYCRNIANNQYVMLVSLKDGRYFKVRETGEISPNSPAYGYSVCSLVGLTDVNPGIADNGYHNPTNGTETWAPWVK